MGQLFPHPLSYSTIAEQSFIEEIQINRCKKKIVFKSHTTIVTPTDHRGRSMSITLELVIKGSQSVTHPHI